MWPYQALQITRFKSLLLRGWLALRDLNNTKLPINGYSKMLMHLKHFSTSVGTNKTLK
jgi:hypothetical protein